MKYRVFPVTPTGVKNPPVLIWGTQTHFRTPTLEAEWAKVGKVPNRCMQQFLLRLEHCLWGEYFKMYDAET